MLIVDLMMPTLDGEGFLRMLGSTRPPVVLLTASTRRKELAKELGISISMSKPFDIAAIRQLANEHVPEHKRPPDAPAKPAE
jgi:DNA-binding response OmpR family regulator